MLSAAEVVVSPYGFKPARWSSHSLLLSALPEQGEGRRVLDVGCASGYLAVVLANRGYELTCIERRTPPGFPESLRLIEADLEDGLPRLDARFDCILCADILEHLRDPGRLLAELRSVLAPGGRVLASLPNSGHAWFRWNVLLGRFPQHERGLFDRTHLHFYTWQGWWELFASAGFAFAAIECSGVPVGLALPRWAGTPAVRFAERLSYESARIWKTLFAYQFIVTAVPA